MSHFRSALLKHRYHPVVMPQMRYDRMLLLPVAALALIGVVMVYSASSAVASRKFGVDYHFLVRQASFVFLGLITLAVCRKIPFGLLRRSTYALLLVAVLILIAVLIPGIGVEAGGARRWIDLGPFTFQPAEFARFTLILYLAHSMAKKGDRLVRYSIGLLPHAIILSILTALIMLQPDFGTVMILFLVTWGMLFIGGVPLRHLSVTFIALAPVIYLFLVSSPYRMRRIISFWDPWRYAADEGYQIVHSLMAFGTGGLWGVGIGGGYQKLFYLPEPHTDFIFSVIGEEMGLVGVAGVLICYLLVLWLGMRIAMAAEDTFSVLLASGITLAMGLQVLINIGVTLALLPTKGLTLPFLSYGGTSMIIHMAFIGILMNIGARQFDEFPH